jgi:ribosomal protein L15
MKSSRFPVVKILGSGQISKSLSVSGIVASASAKVAIEKAGGTLI